jgi:predicted P-loop ATPase
VNDEGGFFNDPTGSRRYMTAALRSIVWDYEREIDPRQVWAQAYALFTMGEPWNLTPEEQARVQEINAEYEFTLPTHDWLDRYIDEDYTDGAFLQYEDLKNAITATADIRVDAQASREIAGWMKKNGYEAARQWVEVMASNNGSVEKRKKLVRGYLGVKLSKKPAITPTGL